MIRLLTLLAATMAVAGCRYQGSICDESPGSGCAECTASCQQDFEYDHHDRARLEACERQCTEGEWTVGWPPGCGPAW